METLLYITFGVTIFNFIMNLGVSARTSNIESVVSSHIKHNEVQLEFNELTKTGLENFNDTCRLVQKYHGEIDTWTNAVEERLSHVESATIVKQG